MLPLTVSPLLRVPSRSDVLPEHPLTDASEIVFVELVAFAATALVIVVAGAYVYTSSMSL
jgi:hypothetical protein